jgi:peptidyl-tRNA hydrolase
MSYLKADRDRQERYHQDGIGTKVVLEAKGLGDLLRIEDWARGAGLPHFLVTDTGRNTSFNGVPTVSAIGVGPLAPEESRQLRKFQLLP